jgi:hypothetical protein
MKEKRELKAMVNTWRAELNKIIVGWNLLPGPLDEFDALTHRLIGHLTRGADQDKIYDLLESELIVRYGLDPTTADLEEFAHEIHDWWIDRQRSDSIYDDTF